MVLAVVEAEATEVAAMTTVIVVTAVGMETATATTTVGATEATEVAVVVAVTEVAMEMVTEAPTRLLPPTLELPVLLP